MRKWDDIVKDKLGEYASNLPEDSLVTFHSRRALTGATKAKRFPLAWALVPAIAAGLAAVLFLRKPTVQEEGIQIIPQPVEVYGQVDDCLDTATPPEPTTLIAQAIRTKTVRHMPKTEQPEEPAVTTEAEELLQAEEPLQAEDATIPEADDIVAEDSSPFVPLSSKDSPSFKMGNGGAIAAGGGLVAALATQLAKTDMNDVNDISDIVPTPGNEGDINGPRDGINGIDDGINGPYDGINGFAGDASHRRPLVIGISFRYPVTERIGITTGLEYSLYSSSFSYLTGEKTQSVHYLGIPVRLDWTFASSKWLEAYLGAGIKGDLCMGAKLDGKSIGKDGPAFRLLGVSGIQFNATRRLSLFVEPEISWTLPSGRRVLSTYSSEHPWMFTVATGIRFNLGK